MLRLAWFVLLKSTSGVKIMDGIICINKEKGYTSFDVVGKLRKILGIKKIGHGGTLDPMAVGVLPIFIGKATKASSISLNNDKEYIAELKFGISTDTQDITGKVIEEKESMVRLCDLEEVIKSFLGVIRQIPPMYSAVKVKGQRLYKLAREGKEVEREFRLIKIKSIDILEFFEDLQTAKLKVYCEKGTYIRTLCNDIGEKLGVGATLISLVRTRTGIFDIEKSITLGEVQAAKDQAALNRIIISIDSIFVDYPLINLNEVETFKFSNGVKFKLDDIEILNYDVKYRVYGQEDKFIGIGYIDQADGLLKSYKMFA